MCLIWGVFGRNKGIGDLMGTLWELTQHRDIDWLGLDINRN